MVTNGVSLITYGIRQPVEAARQYGAEDLIDYFPFNT